MFELGDGSTHVLNETGLVFGPAQFGSKIPSAWRSDSAGYWLQQRAVASPADEATRRACSITDDEPTTSFCSASNASPPIVGTRLPRWTRTSANASLALPDEAAICDPGCMTWELLTS